MAVVLPVMLVVLAAAVGVLACVGAQLRCLDAAALAARAAARGDAAGDVREVAARAAPPDATVEVVRHGGQVTVTVTAELRPFGGPLAVLPTVRVSARAVAADEQMVGR
jgi:Flp pilus assembly protein TadG